MFIVLAHLLAFLMSILLDVALNVYSYVKLKCSTSADSSDDEPCSEDAYEVAGVFYMVQVVSGACSMICCLLFAIFIGVSMCRRRRNLRTSSIIRQSSSHHRHSTIRRTLSYSYYQSI